MGHSIMCMHVNVQMCRFSALLSAKSMQFGRSHILDVPAMPCPLLPLAIPQLGPVQREEVQQMDPFAPYTNV